jgi:type VI secretion system protein ImpE
MMKAKDYYQAGDVNAAIAAALEEVKQAPADAGRRGFLCELLCFVGDLERADRQLDALANLSPEAAVGVALFRQLIRAEQARQQFYAAGAVPEFLGEPTPALKLYVEASICLRENKTAEAAKLLAQAEEQRPKPAGTCDGQAFDDLRDLDDLTAGFLEVLTSTGKYFWVPMERVELLELRPPTRPRDLLWQRAHLVVRGGPDGEVYLPTLYAGTHADADDKVRLGRYTDWRGGDGTPVRGLGLRTFLVGNDARSILEMKEVTVNDGPTE